MSKYSYNSSVFVSVSVSHILIMSESVNRFGFMQLWGRLNEGSYNVKSCTYSTDSYRYTFVTQDWPKFCIDQYFLFFLMIWTNTYEKNRSEMSASLEMSAKNWLETKRFSDYKLELVHKNRSITLYHSQRKKKVNLREILTLSVNIKNYMKENI